MGAARATLTREDSEWSRKFEENWQSRLRVWRGMGQIFLQGRVKGLAKSLQRDRVEMLLDEGAFREHQILLCFLISMEPHFWHLRELPRKQKDLKA